MTTPSGAPGPLLRGAGQRAVGEVSPLTTNSSTTELWPARVGRPGGRRLFTGWPLIGKWKMNSDLGKVDSFCPSCNVHVEAKVIAHHCRETAVIREDLWDPTDRQYTDELFTFAACIRCDGPLLMRERRCVIEGNAIPQDEACRVYPSDTILPAAVPNTAARPYREACQAYRIKLYDSCAAMCRKTVEAVCGHYGEPQGSLARRLDRLLERGIIDKAMFDWTQELRLSGNRGAHADARSVTKTEANDMLAFARAVLLYAFELPKRLQQARRRRMS